MSDKLRDAAERWSDAIPGISDGDDNWALTSDDYDEAVRIACAYLAEHPADDETPSELEQLKLSRELHRSIVESVVRNCQHIDDTQKRDEPGPMCGPTWAKVSHVCGLGSTSAIALCREYGVDPDYDCAKD